MVAEHGHRAEAAARKVAEHVPELAERAIAPLAAKVEHVAGEDEQVGLDVAHAREAVDEVGVVDARPHVQVADLDEPRAAQRFRQSGHRQIPVRGLRPRLLGTG